MGVIEIGDFREHFADICWVGARSGVRVHSRTSCTVRVPVCWIDCVPALPHLRVPIRECSDGTWIADVSVARVVSNTGIFPQTTYSLVILLRSARVLYESGGA